MVKLFRLVASFAAALAVVGTAAADDAAHEEQSNIPYRPADPHADALYSNDQSKMTVEQRADGSTIVYMNGQGMQAMTASVDGDGIVHYECADGKLEQTLQQAVGHHDEK